MPTTFATLTHTGLMRRTNEDSYYARPPVFVVADGMGGAQAGEVASAMAARAFEYFLPQSSSPEEELAQVISRANASIYEHAMGDSGHPGMGTTVIAAVAAGDSVAIAHVGDSRAWLIREKEMRRLTEDHSLVAEMVREGQITEEEAGEHPQRSIITRALGVDAQVEVDTCSIRWQAGDLFLLASDGLYGMVSEEEIAEIASHGDDLRDTVRALVEAANARGGTDNITVVMFSPDGSRPGAVYGDETAASFAPASTGIAGTAGPEAGPNGPAEIEAGPAARPATRGRRMRAWLSTPPGLIALGLLLAAMVLGGAWYSTRFAYYLGVEGDKVSIYRGVPYELGPVSLSKLYRSSPVFFRDMEQFEQDRVSRQEIQSRSSAEQMLDNIIQSDRERKEEKQRLLMEEEERQKQQDQVLSIPPGGLP